MWQEYERADELVKYRLMSFCVPKYTFDKYFEVNEFKIDQLCKSITPTEKGGTLPKSKIPITFFGTYELDDLHKMVISLDRLRPQRINNSNYQELASKIEEWKRNRKFYMYVCSKSKHYSCICDSSGLLKTVTISEYTMNKTSIILKEIQLTVKFTKFATLMYVNTKLEQKNEKHAYVQPTKKEESMAELGRNMAELGRSQYDGDYSVKHGRDSDENPSDHGDDGAPWKPGNTAWMDWRT